MNHALQEKLNHLKDKYQKSPESIDYIDSVEKELRTLIEQKDNNLNNPIFKAIVFDAEKKISEINAMLLNLEKLSEEERMMLIKEKKIWKFIFDRFGISLYDEAIKILEGVVDSKISQ